MYKLPNEDKIAKEIHSKDKNILDLVDQELDLAEILLSVKRTSAPPEQVLFVVYQVGLFINGLRALHAIRLLCEHGLAQDQAMVLLRMLFENTANALTLGQGNKIKNAQRFQDFLLIKEYGRLQEASKYAGTEEAKNDWKKLLAERKAATEEIKNRRGIGEYECLRSMNTWRRRSIFDLAKEAGMTDQYQLVYRSGSRVIHSMNVEDWLQSSGNPTEIKFDHAASEKWASEVLLEACELFYCLIRALDETVGANKQEKIKAIRETIGEIRREITNEKGP